MSNTLGTSCIGLLHVRLHVKVQCKTYLRVERGWAHSQIDRHTHKEKDRQREGVREKGRETE